MTEMNAHEMFWPAKLTVEHYRYCDCETECSSCTAFKKRAAEEKQKEMNATGIDWTKPIEAYHPDGRVQAVKLLMRYYDGHYIISQPVEGYFNFEPNGLHWTGAGVGWRIRNVKEQEVTKETDMPSDAAIQYVLDMREDWSTPAAAISDAKAGNGWGGPVLDHARMIEKYEPQRLVDPDLLVVREIVASARELVNPSVGAEYIKGEHDKKLTKALEIYKAAKK